jgi:ribonuclease HI
LRLTLYVDGASKGNPGRASVGMVVMDGVGNVISEKGQTIGRATNNQAEYMALLHGLDEVRRVAEGNLREIKLVVRSDSELLCRQLRGEYRIKNKVLMRLSARVHQKLMMFGSFSVNCIPREQNRLADRLAQRALSDRVDRSTFSLDEKVKS